MVLFRKILSGTLLILICFMIGFSAQPTSAQSINIKEKLPDGEYIVIVDGVEQRTITAAHARQISERRDELDRLKRAQPLYEAQITQLKLVADLAKKDAQLATTQASFERERAEKYQALWSGEQALRLQAEKLMARGRISKFFDNPYVQFALKLGEPVMRNYLAVKRE